MADKIKKQSNFISIEDQKDLESYIRTVDRDLFNLFSYLDRFPRMFEQSSEPTIQRNTFAFWRDTDDGKIYLITNISANQKKIELT